MCEKIVFCKYCTVCCKYSMPRLKSSYSMINNLMFILHRCNPTRKQRESYEEWMTRVITFYSELFLQAVILYDWHSLHCLEGLLTSKSVHTDESCILLDLYSKAKNFQSQIDRNILQGLQAVYETAPAVWSIDLSETRASVFLEVLKLQTLRKPVELRGWSDKKSEVKNFLQCLPYISQLR